jgi:hypothetical protein
MKTTKEDRDVRKFFQVVQEAFDTEYAKLQAKPVEFSTKPNTHTMKKVVFILIAIALSSCTVTMITTAPSILEAHPEGLKDDLFVQANLWMVDNFKNAESVIQYTDKEAGVFKGKALIYYSSGGTYSIASSIYATLTVETRDNYVSLNIRVHEYANDTYGTRKKAVDREVVSLKNSFTNEFGD